MKTEKFMFLSTIGAILYLIRQFLVKGSFN